MKKTLLCSALTLFLAWNMAPAQETVIYTDDFGAGSESNWTVRGSNTDGNQDFLFEFGFDVSTRGVPDSPNGDNIALRLAANIADPAGREAVTAFLTGFPVDIEYYRITVDVYNGFAPPPGGTGTTRNAGIGIEHADPPLGPNHLRAGGDPVPYQSADDGLGQDGLVFSYNTDNDDGSGAFWLLEGDAGDPFGNLTSVGNWADPDNTTPDGHFQSADFYQAIIPENPNDGSATLELMGNQWVPVTITRMGNDVEVEIFDTLIVSYNYVGIGESLISLSNERPFTSVTPDPEASECYFDNLVITDITPPPSTDNKSWALYQ